MGGKGKRRLRRDQPGRRPSPGPVVCLINLGCAKNTVDAERLLAALAEAGLLISEDPQDADVVLVNTCGFIEPAREETRSVLEQMRALKGRGQLKAVVAVGCLVQYARRRGALAEVLAAADDWLGFDEYPALAQRVRVLARGTTGRAKGRGVPGRQSLPGRRRAPWESYERFATGPRLHLGPRHWAYLKIAEGCSNPCTFCAIPVIRGPYRSWPMRRLKEEARALVAGGAVELNLIAQDTTRWGADLAPPSSLGRLLAELDGLRRHGLRWLRLLYAYPQAISDELLARLADLPAVVPYLDLPLQHSESSVLARMGRPLARRELERLLFRLRRAVPGIALRTTFLVGFPGESERDFAALCRFVQETRFRQVGVFSYSPENGTPAAKLAKPVPAREARARQEYLYAVQKEVREKEAKHEIGRTILVLIEGRQRAKGGGEILVGRGVDEAPEVDSTVLVEEGGEAPPGRILPVQVTQADAYQRRGVLLPEARTATAKKPR